MKRIMKISAAGIAVVFALALGRVAVRADAPVGHFTVHGDGTVTDNATGLVWQEGYSPSTQNQALSVAYCAALTTAGGGWRLPTILELFSLVDETRASPTMDSIAFAGTPTERFWSASPVAGTSGGWSIDLTRGNVVNSGAAARARCVR
jgi:hypothetical protein